MQYETDQSRIIQFKPDERVNFDDVELSPHLAEALRSRMGIQDLFEMQQKVMTHLLDVTSKSIVGDVILCAPTGSGKTLAYALPVVQSLMNRRISRLRAVVVVPTRELASQVGAVFSELTKAVGIKVSVISGSTSIVKEMGTLSKAEILIATPGRLVDHLENNKGLVLRWVEYLILDESDRLLQESYHGWIDSVIPVIGNREYNPSGEITSMSLRGPESGILALAIQPHVTARSFSRSAETSAESVRKILVSATQTRNPKRLVRLGLRRPTYFEPIPEVANIDWMDAPSGYRVPTSMVEDGWVVPTIQDKPMALLKMLGWSEELYRNAPGIRQKAPELPRGGVKLIFTKSVESSHRLCRLLELCAYRLGKVGTVLEMSSELSPRRREYVLDVVRRPPSSMDSCDDTKDEPPFLLVVCSDVLARGMDMFHVDVVINYDAPIHIRTYLHRAGRTARAGRRGMVSTLLLSKQVHHFRRMIYQAERQGQKVRVNNLTMIYAERKFLFSVVGDGLSLLRRIIARENLGLIGVGASLPRHTLHELWQLARAVSDDEEDPKSDQENDAHEIAEDYTNAEEPAKKRRKANLEHTSADADDSDLEVDPDITEGGDTFHDLLFAQISRNLSLTTDNDERTGKS